MGYNTPMLKATSIKKFICFLALVGCLVSPAFAGAKQVSHAVVRQVVDGDTLILDSGQKIRLIGVDTPEIHDDVYRNQNHAKKHGRDPRVVDRYALLAKDFLSQSVLHQKVRLEYDWQREDKFGRTLAYVYRESDGLLLNEELIREGYGFAYTRFPFKYSEVFKKNETAARRNRKGLWA